jgi:chorismate mutase
MILDYIQEVREKIQQTLKETVSAVTRRRDIVQWLVNEYQE